jgi:hypothetical protein
VKYVRAATPREDMMDALTFVILGLALLVVFDIAALRHGADSRDRFDSPEWERRRLWRTGRG